MSTVPLFTGTVPLRTQSQTDFNQNVQDILDYQVTLAPAINIVAEEVNTNAVNTATSETNANTSAAEAAASANVTVYNNGTTYNYPDAVIASDGLVYRCLGTGVIGDDPSTSVTGEWIVPNLDRERTIHTAGSGLPNELEDLAVKITPAVLTEGQDWSGVAYTDPDAIGANPTALIYPDGTIVGSTDNGSYVKYPNGELDIEIVTTTNFLGTDTSTLVPLFPIEFVNTDYTVYAQSLPASKSRAFLLYQSTQLTTYSTLLFISNNNSTIPDLDLPVNLLLKGRWK